MFLLLPSRESQGPSVPCPAQQRRDRVGRSRGQSQDGWPQIAKIMFSAIGCHVQQITAGEIIRRGACMEWCVCLPLHPEPHLSPARGCRAQTPLWARVPPGAGGLAGLGTAPCPGSPASTLAPLYNSQFGMSLVSDGGTNLSLPDLIFLPYNAQAYRACPGQILLNEAFDLCSY